MIEAGLDAINISVDAAGKEVFERRASASTTTRSSPTSSGWSRIRDELGKRRPKLILSFVRQNNSADEQAFIEHWREVADKIHITELHNWAGTLNHESDVNYPCYRPWLTFTVLWDGRVSLCCADFDGQHDPRRSEHLDDPGDLERRAYRPRVRISRAAARTSAAPAICRARTRRSGSRSSPEPLASSPEPPASRRILDGAITLFLEPEP